MQWIFIFIPKNCQNISIWKLECLEKKKGTTGFEPVTAGSAIPCSATELSTQLYNRFKENFAILLSTIYSYIERSSSVFNIVWAIMGLGWSYSVMVITVDFESTNPGSNPGRTFFYSYTFFIYRTPKIKKIRNGECGFRSRCLVVANDALFRLS